MDKPQLSEIITKRILPKIIYSPLNLGQQAFERVDMGRGGEVAVWCPLSCQHQNRTGEQACQ